jgi:hypothetical protein
MLIQLIATELVCFEFGFRKRKVDKDDAEHDEHPKGSILAIPYFGLPHEKPFTTYADKGNEPQQAPEGERHYGD